MVKRKKKTRSLKKRILILCEGETEVKYFKGIKLVDDYRRKFTAVNVDIYQPDNYSPLGLATEAIKKKNKAKQEKNSFDLIWIVFDRDHHADVAEACNEAKQNNLNICLSVRCFEFWILLHFEDTTQGFRNCDQIINYIERNSYINNYSKTDNFYPKLKDKTDTAISRGKAICNTVPPGTHPKDLGAYTNAHELVEYLINL